ncbi:MAG TPA: NAD(P)H-binding protein, partial [Acidimicrobiales bacterium]|nr:NAD(P)H-binding protein [Acidimicrobiales bacterium]
MRILVTGATGYIGGRLVPRLLDRGHDVRCIVRDANRLAGRTWVHDVDVVEGDLDDEVAVAAAVDGMDAACYLVHSMTDHRSFRARDRSLAERFGAAASGAGVRRIAYLGGLGDPARVHSTHLVSRHEVGAVLGAAGVPVVELRAAVIVGSGS